MACSKISNEIFNSRNKSNGWLTSQKQTWLNHPSEKHIRLTTPAKRVGTKEKDTGIPVSKKRWKLVGQTGVLQNIAVGILMKGSGNLDD